jgi:SAM-dependent methyltransferase
MDKYLQQNKANWNEITPLHERSEFYDVAGFKAGKCTLQPIELEEIGDVAGKSLLHLQCHFGMDTLSWGRRGAKATGVDFSDAAIKLARQLSKETGIKADFICSDIYKLPEIHKKKYDIVFTSYGVLCWLPDLTKWAEIIAHFLKPGGFFYIVEGHPFMTVFDNSVTATRLNVTQSYFHNPEPIQWEPEGDYADPTVIASHGSYEWTHSLGDISNALIGAGLKIEFLHEFPFCCYKAMPFMQKGKDGWWRLEGDKIPLTFSLKAIKERV